MKGPCSRGRPEVKKGGGGMRGIMDDWRALRGPQEVGK